MENLNKQDQETNPFGFETSTKAPKIDMGEILTLIGKIQDLNLPKYSVVALRFNNLKRAEIKRICRQERGTFCVKGNGLNYDFGVVNFGHVSVTFTTEKI